MTDTKEREVIELSCSKIKKISEYWLRNGYNYDVVDMYAEQYKQEVELPPLAITNWYILVDGWHRLEALEKLGRKTANVTVVDIPRAEIYAEALRRNLKQELNMRDLSSLKSIELQNGMKVICDPAFLEKVLEPVIQQNRPYKLTFSSKELTVETANSPTILMMTIPARCFIQYEVAVEYSMYTDSEILEELLQNAKKSSMVLLSLISRCCERGLILRHPNGKLCKVPYLGSETIYPEKTHTPTKYNNNLDYLNNILKIYNKDKSN